MSRYKVAAGKIHTVRAATPAAPVEDSAEVPADEAEADTVAADEPSTEEPSAEETAADVEDDAGSEEE